MSPVIVDHTTMVATPGGGGRLCEIIERGLKQKNDTTMNLLPEPPANVHPPAVDATQN